MNRDLKLDNLRGLAIFLVVLGHFIQETSFSGLFSYQFIYTFIYLFHMPVMIFVSGYLSKIRPDNVSRAFKAVLIPYLIFNTLWIIVAFLQNGHIPSAMYIIPEVGLWYLLSLFFWRSMLPAASKIRYVFWISILLALFVGTINFKTGLLSISRTICFFPVFLLGFYFKDIKEKFTINKYLAAGSFMVLLVGATLFLIPLTTKILFLRDSYHVMGMGNLEGIALRLIVMVVGMVSTILLFNFMTSKETVLTKVGRNSLSVYVLQFYFIFYLPDILNYFGLKFIFHSYLLTTAYVILATVIVTFILSRDVVNKGVNTLIKSVTNFLIKEYNVIYTRKST
ncbi:MULTISPECIES: acyltransferase family protein [Methanobacterium]|uniref:Acyltransferase family protein n=1 Tax=Methanobacterium veterum TaxID=408577 RepID=A0A9E5DPJ7_9EURY|nr:MULTISPECIES: acyltransferase family protein [Methanobacterium]MCZ3367110.1 acyltransferase family protein [Methanobacterium veterum]MCZ3373742.1 acyltransferase family protein [Methanobacterium veterum]